MLSVKAISVFFLSVFLFFNLIGCATVSKKDNLEQEVAQLNERLTKQDEEIKECRRLSEEKDKKINELKKKLEGFGIFEN